MAKKIKRHIINFRMKMAKVWASIEETQMLRAQRIINDYKHWQ